MYGFTENYVRVKTPFQSSWINTIKKTELNQMDENGVFIFEEV